MTVINMSEFKEEQQGLAPAEACRRATWATAKGRVDRSRPPPPHSVVLLDEQWKRSTGVQDIFYQVFDKGMLRDGEGRDIDFKNTLILMTSNAGAPIW